MVNYQKYNCFIYTALMNIVLQIVKRKTKLFDIG